MVQHPWLDPSGFVLDGGPVGCLFIHGFTSSPVEMRPLGEYLARRGITVSAPLLCGHGTKPADINECRWQDWITDCEEALRELREKCEKVFVAGFSLGGILALYLAETHPNLAGVICYAPGLVLRSKALPLVVLIKCFVKYWPKGKKSDLADPEADKRIWSYDVYPTRGVHELLKVQRITRRNLSHIHQPILIFISTRDKHVKPNCGQIILGGVSSTNTELVTLHRSSHAMLVDVECEEVFRRSYEFIEAHA